MSHVGEDARVLVARLPFAASIGIAIEPGPVGVLRIRMPYDPRLIGNTLLPALHGGAVASIIEIAGQLAVMRQAGLRQPPATIDTRVDYLRAGKPVDTLADAEFVRLGRRVANLRVTAWQDDRARPIATGNIAFLLPTS
jgi:uncharacterized protein (TIGR00369 family)